jgi:Rrf2 family protein
MMSKTAVHALKAVVALAELPDNGFEGAASLAERIRAPQNYLGKLLQVLARAGVLQSQKGLGGGFQLARPPESISLYDIV